MDQMSFAEAEYAAKRKKTRREVLLEDMELMVPWKAPLKVIEPFYPVAGRGHVFWDVAMVVMFRAS